MSFRNKLMNMKESQKIEAQCYALLLLPLIGFFVFKIYPILWTASKAFYYYDQIPSNTRFTGLENFINAFQDKQYWASWITTWEFTFIKLPIEICIALILAVMLKGNLKGAGFFRGICFMPTIISSALISVIFMNMFDYFGFINYWLDKLHIINEPIDWFSTKANAMTILVLGSIWGNFGTNVIYFTSALTNVPDDLYEAATIDGASKTRQFFSITIPMIAPVFQTILLLGINGTIQTGDYIITMTNGAPGGLTHTAGSFLVSSFLPGFATGRVNVGYGCTFSLISSAIFAGVAVIYSKLSAKMQEVY